MIFVGMESEHERTRRSCARWRTGEEATQEEKSVVGERKRGEERKRGNNETVKCGEKRKLRRRERDEDEKKKRMREAKHPEHVNERRQRADHPSHPRHLDSGPGSNEEAKQQMTFHLEY